MRRCSFFFERLADTRRYFVHAFLKEFLSGVGGFVLGKSLPHLVLLGSSRTLRFLEQIVAPVRQVEHSKNGRESDPGNNIDFLCPGWKLVEPDLQKIVVLFWLHMNLTLV